MLNLLIKEQTMYYVETYESVDGPRFRIKAKNGKIIAASEAYSSKAARTRTVNNLRKNHRFQVENRKAVLSDS